MTIQLAGIIVFVVLALIIVIRLLKGVDDAPAGEFKVTLERIEQDPEPPDLL